MKRKTYFRSLTLLIAGFMSLSTVATQLNFDAKAFSSDAEKGSETATTTEAKTSGANGANFNRLANSDLFVNATKQAYDKSVVFALPETVESSDEITVIVSLSANDQTVFEAFQNQSKYETVGEFSQSSAAQNMKVRNGNAKNEILHALNKERVSYEVGADYNVLLNGFELTLTAKDYDTLVEAVGENGYVYLSDEYAPSETEVVSNDVNVYDTGIFDSSSSAYDGSGTVIAVLDTGYDYTHTAFSMNNFHPGSLAFDQAYVAGKLADTNAAKTTAGITVQDVYLNDKIPFAYDYADKDVDIYPIRNEHGTHVAGIIAGKDDTITGVAPNAQLALFKVFSDIKDGARDSWIISALEDCVKLGVDVINMSLGSSSGFTREVDKEMKSAVYDAIHEAGISLVCAASNDSNSTLGSTKNGNLPLTANPDSATVGAPSSYDSALSVASISGVKTPYIMYGDRIIYFNEASDATAEQKHFVDDILKAGETEKTLEYVLIPGNGEQGDYEGVDVTGKIALIRRGITTFEEKTTIAVNHGALGVIIFNNVSGDITMTVGKVKAAVCSISQEDGEVLVNGNGTIKISRDQVAGPFMSSFSSWGPAPDLSIKPEITAHGGDILSSVPGQSYERLSGTSMASPNQAGVTALVRQYVKEKFPSLSTKEIATRVNQLTMSTTDIAYNTNGLPFSVRKQGSGLANLDKATSTPAYIVTYKNGAEMDKSKLELGDDPAKTGVYDLNFTVRNFSNTSLTYDANAIVMTEGVSELKTYQGQTTSTQKGYLLNPTVTVKSVSGNGSASGNTVTVNANGEIFVSMQIVLSSADKQYLDDNFVNGIYVEGYAALTAKAGTQINLNAPYLAFYGDWSQAPIFDLDYFETNADELDDSISQPDKTQPDAYATVPVGGVQQDGDYINYLGSYYFIQNPKDKKISASRDKISISNQENTITSLYGVWAGLLRGAKRVETVITDVVTGEVIYEQTDWNQRKSYNHGGAIYYSAIDYDFFPSEYNLKNNTEYNVKLTAYLDYENDGAETNKRNVFEFNFTYDFESPVLENVDFYTEYDKSTKKTKLFAKMDVYDNHYTMAMQVGYIYDGTSAEGVEHSNILDLFERYPTAIESQRNSTTTVTFELTDYLAKCKESKRDNSFIVMFYDYAMNSSVFEVSIPDEIRALYFEENSVSLKLNEIYKLAPVAYPSTEWTQTLNFVSSDEDVIRVVNDEIVAVGAGEATITATSNVDPTVKALLHVSVADGKGYDKTMFQRFDVTGYTTNKAFYFVASKDREIGLTDSTNPFTTSTSLSMYPSESVTLNLDYVAYYPDDVQITYKSSKNNVTVDANGTIVAQKKGTDTVNIIATMDGKKITKSVNITIKDPYNVQSGRLMNYYGLGGEVVIPDNLSLTAIYQFAFSGYEYIPKGPEDEISEEDPYHSKIWYIGDETITSVVIPEGVKEIGAYAFANLTALESVKLPTTIEKICEGAFANCTKLQTVENLQYAKFINNNAFDGCGKITSVRLDNIIALGDATFRNCNLSSVVIGDESKSVAEQTVDIRSIGARAFAGNKNLTSVKFLASEIKLGNEAFKGCLNLSNVENLNAAVIASGTFESCSMLSSVTLGKKVAVIGENAFKGTNITAFTLDSGNQNLSVAENGKLLLNKAGTVLLSVVPKLGSMTSVTLPASVQTVNDNAFSGNTTVVSVNLNNATYVGDNAFRGCRNLTGITGTHLTHIGDNAFESTAITAVPDLAYVTYIGKYAFAQTAITFLSLTKDGAVIGEHAFKDCKNLTTVTLGNNVKVGNGAFSFSHDEDHQYNNALVSLTIGDNAVLGDYSFHGANLLTTVTLGNGAKIGAYTFYDCNKLATIDLSKVKTIGDYAFSGYADVQTNSMTGEIVSVTYYSAPIVSITLGTSLESLGVGAFRYCEKLTSIDLKAELTSIPDYAFEETGLTDFDFEGIVSVGISSFKGTALTTLDLFDTMRIGDYAFYGCDQMTAVEFANGAYVGKYAFANDEILDTIVNVKNVIGIGAYAFMKTAVTTVDLSNVVLLGDLAFADSDLTAVTLGNKLGNVSLVDAQLLREVNGYSKIGIGENPFANTHIGEFTSVTIEPFGKGSYEKTTNTFTVSDYAKVIDGALYTVLENGKMILTTYPATKAEKTYTVADGTVRISDYAFVGATRVVTVDLPTTLRSVGHKAFYGCTALRTVIFHSISAPAFEEEFDTSYMLVSNLPGESGFDPDHTFGHLDVVDYYLWNITYGAFFFGANFVDYIGHYDPQITMIYPKNGTGYDTFISRQYFLTFVVGNAEAVQTTIDAISAINLLPDRITLADEAAVIAARNAYNLVTDFDQLALVTNLNKLKNAESTISYLKSLDDPTDPTDPTDPEKDKEPDKKTNVVLIVVICLAVVFAGGIVALLLILKTKKGGNGGNGTTDEKSVEGNADEQTSESENVPTEAVETSENGNVPNESAEQTDDGNDA